ncbi:MAG: NAD-dependent succinate-semialdehyde dehydrogenase [Rhodobacteraceae bacterium]|nr:NAD-dependent succinate-semialdehyde dehydrogenase [Paracoccaceae bacterium]PHR55897.1 MAG: NAD-dependent succinate-semialdehyde dehydrogenase [Robiginitomaculum sp.]
MTHSHDYPAPQLYIDGEWTYGTSGKSEPVFNPATGLEIGQVPHASDADLDRAIAASVKGFELWSNTPIAKRATILLKAMDLILSRAKEIARIETLEQGKHYKEAYGEVTRSCGTIRWNVEEARRAYGRVIPSAPDIRLTTIRQPIGPVAAFVPWNFPAGGPLRKLSPGLAAGCSFVIKCSEETPGTICAIVKCFEEAGVPAGVINLVFGDPPMISEKLIAAEPIRMIAFTGSVPVGKLIASHAAKVMKPCIMELGGHAPVIVCADADPVVAAQRAVFAKFMNAGQVCTSPSRFIVHESLHDKFVETFVAGAKKLKIGNGLVDGVQMGPMANPRRIEAMEALIKDAVAKGAKIETGGSRHGNTGWFFEPTVLTDVPLEADMMQLEPFGPLAPIRKFSDLDAALAEANSTPYGLAAYGFTESAATAEKLARGLEAGILSINHTAGSVHEAPSGGVKESGYGREGGPEGYDAYTVTKRISHRLY